MVRWNFFFSFLALSCLATFNARATQIQALYTAACQRQIGIILDVTPREIRLLNLDGDIVNIKRFEVIYYATFLVDTVPIGEVKNPGAVPILNVNTFDNGDLVQLVRGWPVNFGKDKIAFLNDHGTEVLIDRSSIWKLEFDDLTKGFEFRNASRTRYRFEHPYAFASCGHGTTARGGTFLIFPQQLLNDPISIKRELDRFAEGHAQIHQYHRDQDFYARPEIYVNETQLGLWLTAGSRYGASHERANNFTPYLVNQFSSGPFGFQSEFKSGSGPLFQSVHEETQTQVYYRLKADYFHFTGMVDPNLLLVGEKYQWGRTELDANDIRANEAAFLELGFDYGPFSLELYPGSSMNYAAKADGAFHANNASLTRVGFRWQGFRWLLNVIGGFAARDDNGTFHASLFRANLEWAPGPSQRYELSLIARRLTMHSYDDDNKLLTLNVDGNAQTGAMYARYRFKKRYWAGAMVALENLKLNYDPAGEGGGSASSTHIYPKVGALISLSF